MNKEQIKSQINDFIINEMEMDASMITDEASLIHDLGMTSLDFIDIKAFIRREYSIVPEPNDLQKLETLDDLYEYIFQKQIIG